MWQGVTAVCAIAAAAPAPQQVLRGLEPAPRRVVFLAGADDSHPDGTHEYLKAAILLADALERSSVGPRVACEVHPDGWPRDEAVIAQADTIVLLSAGADQRREDHPFLAGERLAAVDRAMRRGCGLVVIHWGLFVPQAAAPGKGADSSESAATSMLRWIGGYFDFESGPEPRRWASRIETGHFELEPVLLDRDGQRHPILNGIKQFSVTDEFYLDLRFPPSEQRDALRFDPLLVAREPEPPGIVLHRDRTPARYADTVAFCIERDDGGRGVGFSGGHRLELFKANGGTSGRSGGFSGNPYSSNGADDDSYQPLLLNAIAWTAKLPIPRAGIVPPDRRRLIEIATPAARVVPVPILLLTGHDHPAHDWWAVTTEMRELLARDPRLDLIFVESLDLPQVTHLQLLDPRRNPKQAAVILAGNHWDQPAPDADARAALLDYVQQGGGLVLPHFAGSAFQATLPAGPDSDWPAFRQQLSARWWRYDAPASGHEPFGPFRVELAAERHPITAGALPWIAHDELYFAQAGTLQIAPLITARSPTTGRYEPLAWAREVGAGRVFQSLLGHAPESYRDPGTARLFVRGVQWAAGLPPFDVAGLAPSASAASGASPVAATFTEGQRGRALDARVRPVELPGHAAAAAVPGTAFTVECCARLFSTRNYNVLVTHQPHASAGHFDLDSRAGDGVFKAYLPGFEPSELPSPRAITDGEWHRLTLQFDATRDPASVALFVDGEKVLDTTTRWRGRSDVLPGPLVIGASYAGTTPRCGSDGVIDEVRVWRGIVAPSPADRTPPRDDATLAAEDFEPAAEVSAAATAAAAAPATPTVKEADRPWTPPPASGPDAPSWEKETDADWRDDRFAVMDTGPFLASTVRTPPATGRERVAKGVTVKLGPAGEWSWLFDTERCEFVAAWEGGLKLEPARFGLLTAPAMPERPWIVATVPGPTRHVDPTEALRRRYRGLHRHGRQVTFDYELGDARVQETARVARQEETGLTRPLLVREFAISATTSAAFIDLCTPATLVSRSDASLVMETERLRILPAPHRRVVRAFVYRGPDADLPRLAEHVATHGLDREPLDLEARTRPGPAQFGEPLVTRGVVAPNDAAYVVDSLAPPFVNPWNALLYFSGLDFLPDGRLAACTAHGDVWLVDGLDAKLERVTWRRFAAGLHQPLGLVVVDGKVLVAGRDGITRLHDDDGDGEADRYEAFQHDLVETGADHLFTLNLERAPDGGLFFIKSGDAGTMHGGSLLRASPDGATLAPFATGWRHGNGLAISASGEIVTSDNQGEWVPATRLDVVRAGEFHGYVPAWRGAGRPEGFAPPLCWLPHEVDNSAGAPVFSERRDFGPLSGQLLHLSFGKARLFSVLRGEWPEVRAGLERRLARAD